MYQKIDELKGELSACSLGGVSKADWADISLLCIKGRVWVSLFGTSTFKSSPNRKKKAKILN